ncbi:MAG: AbrB/MazE/SpoVT family DNA-binding domain-containing protein [Solirubrobacterales bacterium]
MTATIDKAGRLVIPKAIRQRLSLRAGDQVEIEEVDGRIEITHPRHNAPLVETEGGLLTMESGPGIGPDEVREWLEGTRR